jgi:tape measure domain-containing protein
MSGIDERIVEMTFKGESFVASVKGTVEALLSLKNGLNGLKGSEKDINNLDEAGKRFSLKGMADGVSSIAGKFKTLGIVGVTAIATIANKAVNAGISILKSLTIDPIKAGLDVYETKINAIKTILANTQAQGTNLKQVTSALNQLNTYANKTVYNFGQMAKNIGTFTAAGVDLKTSVASIKGIANLAALSGSSSEQASTAMYQLSQAIASGTVKLQDWNSVVNAGLGGKVFQNALIQTAKVHGVAIDQMIKKDKGFRNTLQEGWLTSKILTQTLETFTGDLSASQLRGLGYSQKQTEAILKQAKAAQSSATDIRTLTQLHQALAEEVATAWSHVWEAVIGNVTDATATLSKVHNVLENAFTSPLNGLAKLLEEWDKLGGRDELIQAISDAFRNLGQILGTIGSAFREVFPPVTALTLVKMTVALEKFTESLRLSSQGTKDLKATFVGIFSVVKIVFDIIGGLVKTLFSLFGVVASGGGSFLSLTARIGNFLTKIRQTIESGNALTKFFTILGKILSIPIKAIIAIVGALGGLSGAFDKVIAAVSPFVQKIGQEFSKLAGAVVQGIQSGNFSAVTGIINQLLLGGILVAIRKFIKDLGKGGGGGGLFSTIKESFESLTNTLEVMQANLKAGILQKIAIAVALLAASLLVLSLINVKNLTKALTAITAMFIQLLAAMAVVTKIGGSAGILKMEAIALALNLLSTAIVILAGAVAILAQFSWEQLAKGLSAIAVLLLELVVATALMSTDSVGLIATAYSMEVMAVALNVLSLAVGRLGKLSLANLAKGIGSIAILLAILAGFNQISGVQLIGTAAAMVILGVALNIIARAVETLGSLSPETLAKGLVSIAAALLIIAAAMNLMPPSMIATSLGLVLVASALVIIADALQTMGGQSIGSIAKSLIVLAASLAIIAAAMYLMSGALPGAAALLVVAASLAILTPVLVALGSLSWSAIAKGLTALAAVFLIIAAAGILLTPLIPTLLGLGLAITLLGVGVLAAGAGVLLFATGLTALAVAVTASGAAILSFVTSILSLIPETLKKIGEGIVEFANAIGTGAVAITKAFTAILTALLRAIIKVAPLAAQAFASVMNGVLSSINKYSPRIITTFLNLLLRMIQAAVKYTPRFVSQGAALIVAFLNGVARKIPQVARSAVNVVVAFINAVGNSAQRIVNAGVNMVINLVNGIANKIRGSSGRIHAAAANLGSAIIQGMIAGISGGIGGVIGAAVHAASSALSAAKHFLGISSPSKAFMEVGAQSAAGMAVGITNSIGKVNDSVEKAGKSMLSTLSDTLANAGNVIGNNIDLQPKITPVIDLTEAKKGFGSLNDLSKKQIIAATASTASATSISASNAAAAQSAGLITPDKTNVTFNQYNTSPQSLSAATIYRQTKNQLSIAKGALSSANAGGSNKLTR